jgi:cytosine/adenosine deaminase-related metal-dependent hydrolase
MTSERKLITNACVITLDPQLGDFPCADILVEGDKIAAVGPHLDAPDAERIDGTGMIAVPGFVDGHRHTWQTILRHMNADMTFWEYYANELGRYGPLHKPEHRYAGVLAGALESLDAGTTTLVEYALCVEEPEDADSAVEALREAGIRGFYCHGVGADWKKWLNNSDLPHPAEEARRVRAKYFASNDGLLRFGMALRGPQFTTPAVNRRDFDLARDLGARITMHLIGPGLQAMRDYVGPDTCYVHGTLCTDLELELIRDSGGHVNVATEGEMNKHFGPMTKRLLDKGMRPSLSVDGGGTSSNDMFMAMRLTIQEVRMRYLEEHWQKFGKPLDHLSVTCRDALEWGTIEGARAFGMEDLIGTLTPGKQADIVLVRHDSLHLSPVNHPIASLVQAAGARDVDTVLVAGQVKKRDGKLVGVDLERVRRKLYEARDELFAQGGTPEHCNLRQSYVQAARTASS